eukprot:4300836-Pleurochrysis_carterae.AAC.2
MHRNTALTAAALQWGHGIAGGKATCHVSLNSFRSSLSGGSPLKQQQKYAPQSAIVTSATGAGLRHDEGRESTRDDGSARRRARVGADPPCCFARIETSTCPVCPHALLPFYVCRDHFSSAPTHHDEHGELAPCPNFFRSFTSFKYSWHPVLA